MDFWLTDIAIMRWLGWTRIIEEPLYSNSPRHWRNVILIL